MKMTTSFLNRFILAAMLSSIAVPTFADEAPVYDVDSYAPTPAEVQPETPAAVPMPAEVDATPVTKSWSPSPQSLQDRIGVLEQKLSNLQQSTSSAKMDVLQNEVQSLRGQVEELTHQLQQLQAQQKSMYMDLDKRLSQQQTIKPAQPAGATIAPPQPLAAAKPAKPIMIANNPARDGGMEPNVLEEQQTYQKAYDLIKVKKYNEAIGTLQNVLTKYPKGQFAANAHYWLGELYGLLGKNDQSVLEFAAVVKDFSNSPKVSDAQFKLGLIYATQAKWSDAKSAYKNVINNYPGTASARLAKEQLKQLKLAGH